MRAGSCMNVQAALVLSLEQLAIIAWVRKTAEFAWKTDVVFIGEVQIFSLWRFRNETRAAFYASSLHVTDTSQLLYLIY